jgi:fatty-acid desaturase
VRIGREYDAYQKGLDGYESHEKKAIRYFENIYEYEDDEILLDVLYSIAIGALWVRILYMFRLTRFLGPLLKMIFMMLWDITIFMVLFGILLVIYASIGNLLFYTEDGYADFWASVVTLFGSALGNFDLNLLDNTNKGKLVGELFIISFVIL